MRAQPSRPPDVRAPPLRPRGGVLGAGRVLAEGLAPWDGPRGHRPRIGRDGRRQIARGSAPGGQTCLNATCPAAGHGARTGGFAEARAQHGRPRSRSSNRGHRASGAKPSAGFRSPAPIGRPSGHSSVAASGARGRVPVARLRLVRESRRLRRSVTYDRYGRTPSTLAAAPSTTATAHVSGRALSTPRIPAARSSQRRTSAPACM